MKMKSINPSTEEVVGEFDMADRKQVIKAVNKSRKAFEQWSGKSLDERISILRNAGNGIKNNKEDLSRLIAQEMGKIIKEAGEEVDEVVGEIEWFTTDGVKCLTTKQVELFDSKASLNFEPIGVVGVITPWNFPLSTPLWKIIPALLTGNTVVWKPAEQVPFVSNKIHEIFLSSGVPEEVFALLIGDETTGKYLIDSKIDMLCFTGSSEVGKKVASKSGKKLRKFVLELGGSDPFIVLKDVDIEKAVEGAVIGRLYACGQCCTAAKRFLVHESIVKEFTEKLVEKFRKMKIGDPMDSSTELGPLVSKEQLDNLEKQVKDAVDKGANLLCGGKRPENIKGYFYEPTLFNNVNKKMKILTEEVFGPIAPIMTFKTTKQAIKLANDTKYGLGASIWTNNMEEGKKIASQIKSGMVWINNVNFPYPQCPWGGVKESGIGKELSEYGVLEFVNIKPVIVRN